MSCSIRAPERRIAIVVLSTTSWPRIRAATEDVASAMANIGEARRAFQRFHSLCFWSYRSDLPITRADVPWVAEQLMKHGNHEAWRVAVRLCR